MTTEDRFARRTMLRAGVVIAVSSALAPVFSGAAQARQPEPVDPDLAAEKLAAVSTGTVSTNGWPVEKGADIGGAIWTRSIAGTGLAVALCIGDVQAVLGHVVRRYHYEVDTLQPGEVIGYRVPDTSAPSPEDNHSSGTAVDIRPGWCPAGSRGNLFPAQIAAIRAILDDCRGVVSWGGDRAVPDEAHFDITVAPGDARLAELAGVLRRWKY
ncbi:hypothetical protein [Amycolatopsis sp. ATCC 39116]|uniref:hypothetical protein n=1 Tax=Amycolatopsis sp. (strain ATCC 39116 / 75iv2) TaxID=385957 RepID=UPI0002626E40|nr:hypothetical protein [Amycolatopsis sp. ATCC 39116]